MSINFPPVILGPEMAAPILWAPGIFGFFLLENHHAHKIPPFRGGVMGFLEGGGGSANFIFMGVGIFPIISNRSDINRQKRSTKSKTDGFPLSWAFRVGCEENSLAGPRTKIFSPPLLLLADILVASAPPFLRRNPKGDGRKGTGQKMS